MKLNFSLKQPATALLLLAGVSFASCNKDVPAPMAIVTPIPTGSTIGDVVNTDANFSYLKAALTRLGLLTALQDRNARFTVFAPDNAAFNRSLPALGLPAAESSIGLIPIATLTAIIQYHVLPGQVVTSTMIPESFPNTFMPTLLQVPATPPAAANPLLKFVNFPSRRGTSAFVNNIPVVQADISAANGVVHRMAAVMLPPATTTILQALIADPNYTYLVEAINRADLGMPATLKFAGLLNTASPYANFTLFAPDNAAFNRLFAARGLPQSIAVIQGMAPTDLIGIVAYHVLIRGVLPSGSPDLIRVFSSNLPAAQTPMPTFLNAVNPAAASLRLGVSAAGIKGNVNPTAATITRADWHNLNGVIHAVNQVLLPL